MSVTEPPGEPSLKPLVVSRAQSYPLSSRQDRLVPALSDHSNVGSPSLVGDKLPDLHHRSGFYTTKEDVEQGPVDSAVTEHDQKRLLKRTPLYKTPLPGDSARWHLEENLSIDWGALFYDLVLVAALSAFTSSHRLADPSAIPAFASYYVILYFIWVTQVFYDIRYEGEDSVHRLFKFFQICILIYIGSASGNWSPADYMRSTPDDRVRDYETAITNDAKESLTVILFALLVSRVILALQYTICAFVGRRLHRHTRAFWISVTSLSCSCTILIVVVALPDTSQGLMVAKLTLLYLAILLELVVITFQVWHRMHVAPDIRKIGERYSAVVLIVLGEGLISLVGAFNDSLSGLSDSDVGTYGQAIMSVAIAYLLYTFLFARFRKDSKTGRRRAIAFELVHIPLTFGLLLLFGAIVNVVIVISHGRGTAMVLTDFVHATEDAVNNVPLTDDLRDDLGKYLYKMPLDPPFDVALEQIRAASNASQPTEIASIISLQYAGQILATSFTLYDLELTEETVYAFIRLSQVNTTWDPDVAVRQARIEEATELVFQTNSDPFIAALSGTLWIFPAAGIVLMLCSLRSLSWSLEGTPLANLILGSFHMTGGLTLALMGLLGLGDKSFDLTRYAEGDTDVLPMYAITLNQYPLLIVVAVYTASYLTPIIVLELTDRWKEPMFTEQNVSWLRRCGYMTVGI